MGWMPGHEWEKPRKIAETTKNVWPTLRSVRSFAARAIVLAGSGKVPVRGRVEAMIYRMPCEHWRNASASQRPPFVLH
jgi:hypothetical protein